MRFTLIALTCTALMACGEQTEPTGPERQSAAGQVLGGEITDAMLPLDTVRSTSPAERRVLNDARTGSGDRPAAEPAGAGEPSDDPSPDASGSEAAPVSVPTPIQQPIVD